MNALFISGSRSIQKLNSLTYNILDNVIKFKIPVLVGDACGVDYLVQKYFASKKYYDVKVFTILHYPRNLASSKFKVEVINTKNKMKHYIKDNVMTKLCSSMLVIWDGKSKGSYYNIIRGITGNKKVNVILNEKLIYYRDICLKEIENIYQKNNKGREV